MRKRQVYQCMSPVSKGKYVMKRMPNSGSTHRPDCAAYEPPAELSGLGEILGTAIQENIKEGTTTLNLILLYQW